MYFWCIYVPIRYAWNNCFCPELSPCYYQKCYTSENPQSWANRTSVHLVTTLMQLWVDLGACIEDKVGTLLTIFASMYITDIGLWLSFVVVVPMSGFGIRMAFILEWVWKNSFPFGFQEWFEKNWEMFLRCLVDQQLSYLGHTFIIDSFSWLDTVLFCFSISLLITVKCPSPDSVHFFWVGKCVCTRLFKMVSNNLLDSCVLNCGVFFFLSAFVLFLHKSISFHWAFIFFCLFVYDRGSLCVPAWIHCVTQARLELASTVMLQPWL